MQRGGAVRVSCPLLSVVAGLEGVFSLLDALRALVPSFVSGMAQIGTPMHARRASAVRAIVEHARTVSPEPIDPGRVAAWVYGVEGSVLAALGPDGSLPVETRASIIEVARSSWREMARAAATGG